MNEHELELELEPELAHELGLVLLDLKQAN